MTQIVLANIALTIKGEKTEKAIKQSKRKAEREAKAQKVANKLKR